MVLPNPSFRHQHISRRKNLWSCSCLVGDSEPEASMYSSVCMNISPLLSRQLKWNARRIAELKSQSQSLLVNDHHNWSSWLDPLCGCAVCSARREGISLSKALLTQNHSSLSSSISAFAIYSTQDHRQPHFFCFYIHATGKTTSVQKVTVWRQNRKATKGKSSLWIGSTLETFSAVSQADPASIFSKISFSVRSIYSEQVVLALTQTNKEDFSLCSRTILAAGDRPGFSDRCKYLHQIANMSEGRAAEQLQCQHKAT